MYALIQNGTVWELFDNDPMLPGTLDVRDVSKVKDIKQGYVANKDGTYSLPPELPGTGKYIGDVSSAQAKIQLLRAGFLVPVQETVKALGGEIEIWFNEARTWQRKNPHVVSIGAGLTLSEEDIDQLFLDAAKIDA